MRDLMSLDEIAVKLGLTEPEVRVALYTGLNKLRRHLRANPGLAEVLWAHLDTGPLEYQATVPDARMKALLDWEEPDDANFLVP